MSVSPTPDFRMMIMAFLLSGAQTKTPRDAHPRLHQVRVLATGRRFVRPWLLGSAHRSRWADGRKVKVVPPARGCFFPCPHRLEPPQTRKCHHFTNPPCPCQVCPCTSASPC